MLKGKRIVVVLPAYNAEKTLKKTYDEIPLDIVDEVLLERVMHLERGSASMDAEQERHPRVGGDPVQGDSLDSRVRGNDHGAERPLWQGSRAHNTRWKR